MTKTILITGSTDGIGLEAARMLLARGHHILLHGRNPDKLDAVEKTLSTMPERGPIGSYVADLSRMADVAAMAQSVSEQHDRLDVLINNAGVFHTRDPRTASGLDVRFVVNTLAPCLLTQRLLPRMSSSGRVINLSSAAQAAVDTRALSGQVELSHGAAYAQSKLALTMWSRALAHSLGERGPAIIAVNPGSMLGTKMVKEGFGVAGGDIRIGGDILTRLAVDDEFQKCSGQYFDNDAGRFAAPHPDALDPHKSAQIVEVIEALVRRLAEGE